MKKGKVLGLFAMSAMLLTGCVDAMPELTTEQSDIIAEYAAGLLLKYSSNYNYKIVSDKEVAAAMAELQENIEPETEKETEEETDKAQTEDDVNQNTSPSEVQTEEQETETEQIQFVTDLDFAAELGIDDLIIRYQSFELCNSYPQNNSGFSVDAAQGKKLLVIHFDMEGLPEEDVNCNLFDYDIKMRVNINDSNSAVVLNTMLPNDLATYMDVVQAGAVIDVVAVAEVDDITEEEIQTLTLRAASIGQSCVVKIK
ncbi:MAG: hypothetical protein K2M91_14350 [Lachnospiraceae bacterium]|nr:hypothetical protein [Lachnospiraceae bacterium]